MIERGDDTYEDDDVTSHMAILMLLPPQSKVMLTITTYDASVYPYLKSSSFILQKLEQRGCPPNEVMPDVLTFSFS